MRKEVKEVNDILFLKDISQKTKRSVLVQYLQQGCKVYYSNYPAQLRVKADGRTIAIYLRVYTEEGKKAASGPKKEDMLIVTLEEIMRLVIDNKKCNGILIDERFPLKREIIETLLDDLELASMDTDCIQ